MRLVNNPCKGCVDKRTAECHATCEAYLNAKKQHEELKVKERLMKEADGYEAEVAKRRRKT